MQAHKIAEEALSTTIIMQTEKCALCMTTLCNIIFIEASSYSMNANTFVKRKNTHAYTEQPGCHTHPDIVVVDKEQKRAVVTDVAIPADSDIRQKDHEKIKKYQ